MRSAIGVAETFASVGAWGDACLGDTCLGDACLGDTCLGDTCLGDTCLGDTCLGDTCLGDTCLGDTCLGVPPDDRRGLGMRSAGRSSSRIDGGDRPLPPLPPWDPMGGDSGGGEAVAAAASDSRQVRSLSGVSPRQKLSESFCCRGGGRCCFVGDSGPRAAAVARASSAASLASCAYIVAAMNVFAGNEG
jgi:hypothetical protein